MLLSYMYSCFINEHGSQVFSHNDAMRPLCVKRPPHGQKSLNKFISEVSLKAYFTVSCYSISCSLILPLPFSFCHRAKGLPDGCVISEITIKQNLIAYYAQTSLCEIVTDILQILGTLCFILKIYEIKSFVQYFISLTFYFTLFHFFHILTCTKTLCKFNNVTSVACGKPLWLFKFQDALCLSLICIN